MAAKFQNGDNVVQVVPAPIAGKVVRFAFDENTGVIQYIVAWVDADGVTHEKAFNADELNAAPTA